MPKIKILGKHLSKQELNEAKSLAADAGCPAADVAVVESVGEPDDNSDDEVILIVANAPTCSDPGLENEFSKAQNGGRRVVCIWPKSAGGAKLPDAAAKYAYSILPWNTKKLSGVLADDDVTCFENDAGVALPKVPMDRNQCVDEPKQPKK